MKLHGTHRSYSLILARSCAALALVAAASFGGACGSGEPARGAASTSVVSVTGSVLDTRTGEPVADATVRGPHETRARTDDRGRFALHGLQLGDAGELTARAEDGRTGAVALRPLRGGALEVVIHVAAPPRDE